jgi:redox-sensitive bicupin YhaK (pirin superfamily)
MQHAGMDPILMIDELRSEYREDFAGGFPPHPHRGMQTLTYMKQGGIIHEDNQGNRGEIRGGGAQWMSAGSGIIHSEMPTQDTRGLHGFQLWINLPAAEKMSAPRYRDVPGQDLVSISGEGFKAVLVSGSWQLGRVSGEGPLDQLARQAAIADLELAPGAGVELATGSTENVLAYIYDGSLAQGDSRIEARHLVITDAGELWQLVAGDAGARLLLLRGEPLAEPVAHYGPFVMNTAQEIEQAIQDYQSGRFARPAA